MLSDRADEIKKAIEKVLKDRDIEQLLEDYRSDPDRNFIQKYAETEITTLGVKVTCKAVLFSGFVFAAAIVLNCIFILLEDNELYKVFIVFYLIIFLFASF